jgi:hypothetical protein
MRKQFILVVSVIFLAACSTTPQVMRQDPPALALASKNEPKAVASCIADKWENIMAIGREPDVNLRPTKNGYSITFKSSVTINYLADIESSGQGSLTNVFTHMTMSMGDDPVLNDVVNCQK